MRTGHPGRGHRAREPRVARVVDAGEHPARAFEVVELEPRRGFEEVTEVGARRVVADDIGPRLDLPRAVGTEQETGDERGGRGPNRGVGGAAAGQLEEVECLVVAELRQQPAGLVELLAA